MFSPHFQEVIFERHFFPICKCKVKLLLQCFHSALTQIEKTVNYANVIFLQLHQIQMLSGGNSQAIYSGAGTLASKQGCAVQEQQVKQKQPKVHNGKALQLLLTPEKALLIHKKSDIRRASSGVRRESWVYQAEQLWWFLMNSPVHHMLLVPR